MISDERFGDVADEDEGSKMRDREDEEEGPVDEEDVRGSTSSSVVEVGEGNGEG